MFPRVAGPGFVARLAGSGNGVEAPDLLAGLGVVSGDEAANAVLAAGGADDHFVLHHERRERDGVAGVRIGHLGVPQRMAALGIDRDDVRVDGAHEQSVARIASPRLTRPQQRRACGDGAIGINPEDAAGGGVERHDVVGRLHQVHDAVDNQR